MHHYIYTHLTKIENKVTYGLSFIYTLVGYLKLRKFIFVRAGKQNPNDFSDLINIHGPWRLIPKSALLIDVFSNWLFHQSLP
ncbi:hypothetical protein FF125_09440 [Aureibaculum algae]|uniref:Uncharacterized protein n=1 Tax=Aureibaculum algae TaxID=2584122 RepID=A0A5B7TTV7_9FLAO|nr:hypothetical protein [Aureibaculum algae]QCX38643.1 hypothetical protein FF125_09440 [Aureibaculum algae]